MHEQPARKPRVPLSKEELFYVIETKKLKQQQQLVFFKASVFYKIINCLNIALAAFLCYATLSILFFCTWSTDVIKVTTANYGDYNIETQTRQIINLQLTLVNENSIEIKPINLLKAPANNTVIFVGKDYLMGKIIKTKLANEQSVFWCTKTYPIFTVCCFALIMGFFIYLANRHLTYNGLLTALGLFTLASLYFLGV